MTPPRLSRRDFAAAAGAIVLAFSLVPGRGSAETSGALPESLETTRNLDAWIRIDAGGNATVCTGKVELGQGLLTALAQIAAEELDLPIASVRMISGDTAATPDEGFTAGSRSIETSGHALRVAAAEVRAILLDLAAQRLGVAATNLTTRSGVITAPDGRTLGYGELAGAAELRRNATATVPPKAASAYTIVGTSVPRLDLPGKMTGTAAFVQDFRLSGMLHARVVRPPRYDATLEKVDTEVVKDLPGLVALVRDGSFLAVVTEREEEAVRAREILLANTTWSAGAPLPTPEQLYDRLMSSPTEDDIVSESTAAEVRTGTRVQATYRKPCIAHASIGPSAAVAEFRDGVMTVWSASQGVHPLRRSLATVLSMQPSDIRCLHLEGAGCYGHNGADDAALDAALLARAVPGRPVRVQWMREDEFGFEPYGPAMIMAATGMVARDGHIADWSYEVWSNSHFNRPGESGHNLLAAASLADAKTTGQPVFGGGNGGGGDRNARPPYDLPRHRIVHHLVRDMPLRVSSLRSLGAYANVFAIESFMDELAAAAGADPLAFRLAHLTDERSRAVLTAAARKAGWKPNQTGSGRRGRGIGFARYDDDGAWVAVVAELGLDRRSGAIRIPRVVAAVDAGQIINPDGIVAQIEGGIIQATSWTLKEAVQFTPLGITSRSWADYPILTLEEVPKVEVELINRPGLTSLGAGEAALGPAAAAIANAFAHAAGRRLRELPLTPARVLACLAEPTSAGPQKRR